MSVPVNLELPPLGMRVFWWLLPLGVLAPAIAYLTLSTPRSGWTDEPVHPRALATVYLDDPSVGIRQLIGEPGLEALAFSTFWQKAQYTSAQLDSMATGAGGAISRAASLIVMPNGDTEYIEALEYDADSLRPEAWLSAFEAGPGPSWVLRQVKGLSLAERTDGRLAVLFLGAFVCASPSAAVLEDLAQSRLTAQTERALPDGYPYGIVLYLDHWLGQSSLSLGNIVYPLARLATTQRIAMLLPQPDNSLALCQWQGSLYHTPDRVLWPRATLLQQPAPTIPELPDGWQARINQSQLGHAILLGQDDTLSALRKRIFSQAISIGYRLLPQPALAPAMGSLYILEGNQTNEIAKELASLPGTVPSGQKQGNTLWRSRLKLPSELLGLPWPEGDSCYWWYQAERLYLCNQQLALKRFTPHPEPDAATSDAWVSLSPGRVWDEIARTGPASLKSMQKALPVTASRFKSLAGRVSGDRLQLSLRQYEQAPLASPLMLGKPFFANLFNAPLLYFGRFAGHETHGWALSQTGRLYFFEAGQLSYLQVQVDAAPLQASPVMAGNLSGRHILAWVQGGIVHLIDQGGRDLSGQTLRLPAGTQALRLAAADTGIVLSYITADGSGHARLLTKTAAPKLDGVLPQGKRPFRFALAAGLNQGALAAFATDDGTVAAFMAQAGQWQAISLRLDSARYDAPPILLDDPISTSPGILGISTAGLLNAYGANGIRLVQKQIYQPDRQTRFSAITGLGPSWHPTILRQTGPSLAVYNHTGLRQFEVLIPRSAQTTQATLSDQSPAAQYLVIPGDTTLVLNRIGNTACRFTGKGRVQAFSGKQRGTLLIAVEEGRQLHWYRK